MDPARAKILAMQESVRARLAAAKAAQQSGVSSKKRPAAAGASDGADDGLLTAAAAGQASASASNKRAKVYELDLSVTAPTFEKQSSSSSQQAAAAAAAKNKKQPIPKQKPSNPYLAHTAPHDDDEIAEQQDDDTGVDARLQRAGKTRQRHKELSFVEPGTYQEIAEIKRNKERKAAASGYLSGRKQGHTIRSASYASNIADDIDGGDLLPPRIDAHPDTFMPVAVEWWDAELLPSKWKKQLAARESQRLTQRTQRELQNQMRSGGGGGAAREENDSERTKQGDDDAANPEEAVSDDKKAEVAAAVDDEMETLRTRCWEKASLSYSKTAALVQHIVPIQPANSSASSKEPPKQAVLHLTKKERQRQRKLRRQEKQRELQDLQAAGLIPAPEPRLTLQNFMQVLGDQAVLDPSQIERKVQEQMEARQRAHAERNAAGKLTREQRAAKRAAKLQKDADASSSDGRVNVALYHVADLSHPYHRTKVDLNAQQYNLTGLVLECRPPDDGIQSEQQQSFACVMVEGGPKGIQKFHRLMTVRMKWTGPDDDDDESDEEEEQPVNDDMDQDGTSAAAAPVRPQKFNKNNRCACVWRGLAVQRLFHGFLFQAVESPAQARKVLKTKGAEHYWDQVVLQQQQQQHHATASSTLPLKLARHDDDDDEQDNPYDAGQDEDIVMKDAS